MVEQFSFTGPPSIIWIARYDPTLPRPWKGLIDPSTGWLYFWNPETNVTQYERPSAPLYYHQFQLQQYPYPWLPRYDRPQLQYSHRYPEPLPTSHAPICDSPSIPIAVRAPHPVTVNYPRYRSLIRERGVDRDRISELPDELICHILSFLPTISAVRTTLLSKRWNKLWTFVRHLDFDLNRDWPDGTFSFFERFVEFVFLRLVSLDIGKCRLRYTTASWIEDDFSHVDDWISFAVSRNVVELDLRIFVVHAGHLLCRLPKSIFWCKTLKVLKLWIDYIDIPDPPTKGSFPNLKILHVTVTNPNNELGKLLSYFPVVEDLSIHGQLRYSYMYYHNINLKVSFPELKTLKLSTEREERAFYEMGHDYGGTLNQYHFCVDAPKLENLDLVQIPSSNYILENPKSVVNASIAFKSLAEEEWSSFPDRAFQLLTGISNVKCLSLSDHPFEASNLPVFGNLKQLKLVLRNCSSWGFLAALLHRTPNLEDLDLVLEDLSCTCSTTYCGFLFQELLFYAQRTGGEKDYPKLQWTPPEFVPNCLSSHLKTISIRGFKGLQFEMIVVKYMLLNGCHLNKMTIYTSMLEKEEEYSRDLLSFQRVMTCQVEFREMQF